MKEFLNKLSEIEKYFFTQYVLIPKLELEFEENMVEMELEDDKIIVNNVTEILFSDIKGFNTDTKALEQLLKDAKKEITEEQLRDILEIFDMYIYFQNGDLQDFKDYCDDVNLEMAEWQIKSQDLVEEERQILLDYYFETRANDWEEDLQDIFLPDFNLIVRPDTDNLIDLLEDFNIIYYQSTDQVVKNAYTR